MKNILFVVLGLTLFTLHSCNTGNGNNNEKTEAKALIKDAPAETSNVNHTAAIHITKSEFLEKVWDYETHPDKWEYKGDKPCIIDFYADWCGPCKIAAPILEELAIEYGDKIYIYKIDTEKERELAGAFGIQSIPAFLYCPKEGQPQMAAGIGRSTEETKQMFKSMIDDFLLAKK